jgi:ribonucleoside-triphosphate reductase
LRNLEDIEKDLASAREALSHAEGTPTEVYSRIVGYYRSVRNWNKGKREEYGERKLFSLPQAGRVKAEPAAVFPTASKPGKGRGKAKDDERLMLFVRPTCPACPGAKAAAGRLGIPIDLVNADTEAGMAEAVRRQVFSTPTAILLDQDGAELGRALDAGGIRALIAV